MRIPAGEPDEMELGEAWNVLAERRRDTVIQPLKPPISAADGSGSRDGRGLAGAGCQRWNWLDSTPLMVAPACWQEGASLIQYLRSDGERLLRGRYPEAVGSALYSAVAEATLLAAWMSYDATPRSPHAQRYFIQALGLANAAGDHLLGAGILDAMSHQATYTGRFGEAANPARAARTGTSGIATATLTAHFHTMEARALARLGDAKAWCSACGC
jgi:hypothetical protein